MYPTKSSIDYTMEINRLFQNTNETDVFDIQTNSQLSPFNNSTVNRSSSSADSVSPESFPNISRRVYTSPSVSRQQDFMGSEYQSPNVMNRHRPIIGRRLMTSDSTPILQEENYNKCPTWDVDVSVWKRNEVLAKPLDTNIYTESEKKFNTFYELFPESQFKGSKSPMGMSNISLDSSNIYRRETNSQTLSIKSPNMGFLEPLIPNQCHLSSPMMLGEMFGPSSSKIGDTQKVCTFCRKNGETPLVYTTHVVKQKVGNKQIVTCPILRSHVCSTCGVSGDQAHTITYCPVLRNSNNGQPLLSTTITLKNTRVKSNGRRRY